MLSLWQQNRFTIILFVSLVVLGFFSLFVGVLDVNLVSLFTDKEALEVFLISRLPRLMAILMAGMGLSVAGLIMQNLCMNKFVSPSTAATIQSSQLGILIAILFFPASTLMERAFFSFAFAMLGTWIFVSFIQRVQMKDIILVPLVGIMFGNIISGITGFISFKFEMTQAMASFTVGHFSTVIRGHYEIVYLVLPVILIAAYFARHFNIVGMGRNFAQNLGVNYRLFLLMGLTLAAMITASVVVVVGTISYIGLIVPNLVTIYKGDNLKNTIVDTALSGALFVLVCDLIGRVIIYPYELPIELIVGCVGSAIFIGLIFYRLNGTKGRKAKWAKFKSMMTAAPTPCATGLASVSEGNCSDPSASRATNSYGNLANNGADSADGTASQFSKLAALSHDKLLTEDDLRRVKEEEDALNFARNDFASLEQGHYHAPKTERKSSTPSSLSTLSD